MCALKMPSVILNEVCAKTRREYASIVFRCIQEETNSNITKSCFISQEEADRYQKNVLKRIDCSLPCDKTDECIILPPLFLRSSGDSFCQLTSQIFLILYKQGPIIPFVRLHSKHNIANDTNLLNCLICLYGALSQERATKENIVSILNASAIK